MTYAKSGEGQFMFTLLRDFSMTPAEWRELDPRDAAFLLNAYSHRLEQERQARERAKAQRGRR